MLTHERKSLILTRLKDDGRIVAKSLSRKLNLSEDTIRRDLRELAAEGLLTRVHGGALPASPTVASFQSRRSISVQEKRRLGQCGATLLQNGAVAFVDGGTTNLEMIRALPLDRKATIVTHSPTIVVALESHIEVEVIIVGGRLFRHSMVATGATAHDIIAGLRVDAFFLGVTGMHPDEGLTTGDFEEAAIKRAVMKRAAETIVLLTADKIGAVSPHRIATVAAPTTLVVGRKAKLPAFSNEKPRIMRAS